jgi:hypothetical protein
MLAQVRTSAPLRIRQTSEASPVVRFGCGRLGARVRAAVMMRMTPRVSQKSLPTYGRHQPEAVSSGCDSSMDLSKHYPETLGMSIRKLEGLQEDIGWQAERWGVYPVGGANVAPICF